MGDHSDMPFKAEYAKSNRSSCKSCKSSIGKDSLRLALMVQSPVFDGKVPNWYHYACFWKRARVNSEADIHGFDALRWDDQKKIKDNIKDTPGGGGDAEVGMAAGYSDYSAQYAKSNRSSCRKCGDKIAKDEIRLSRKDFDSERSKLYGPQDEWHHLQCFVENRDHLEFSVTMDPTQIPGYSTLKKEDKDEILQALGKGVKKRKGDTAKEATAAKKSKKDPKETKEEKALKEQSQRLWEIRDKLAKEVSNEAMKIMLEYNKQSIPSGESKLLDRVSDCMDFGALEPCPECPEGQLAYSGDGYKCTGNMTEWTKCMHNTQTPKRRAFKVPKEFHDVDFLKKYKYVKRDRVFPARAAATTSGLVSSKEESSKPLYGMKFVIIGKTSKSKGDLTKEIASLGGSVVPKIDKKVAACISTQAEVKKNSKAIKDAKKADVHVVSEDFLEKVKKGGAALLITSHSIADWGSDPHDRIGDVVDGPSSSKSKSVGKSMASKREEDMYTKYAPSTMKIKVKGGSGVDPDSGLSDSAHVLEENGSIYNAVLGMVDIAKGTNSYYKVQILESDTSKRWWTFRSWGRVGTTIGSNKTETHTSKSSAISNFEQLYAEKTGNPWSTRSTAVKNPGKFFPLDIDYGADDDEVKGLNLNSGAESKLKKPVQDLVKMIFNVESMKKAMLEFEIDLKKMPLGKLSKKQIQSAYKVLTELLKLITDGGTETKFLDGSNRFYTLIPHDFGMKKPPLLDTADIIKSKTEMLDNLLEIEVAYSLLKTGDTDTKDPLDVCYEKLKTDIEPLDKKDEEYKRMVEYVKNTHASTHNQYDLEVLDIFSIAREGEGKRFKPFKSLHNRQLLWHGSRTTNYGGILSQGLRIAPPEAPVTGYMFGKGVYFADMVSKSANYCRTSKSDPVGVLLLCEVALGNMYELKGSEYVNKLPSGKHSTKGLGRTVPDPAMKHVTPDGIEIPMGKSKNLTSLNSSLLYNEYIVYDTAQINIKYLLEVNFKYKY